MPDPLLFGPHRSAMKVLLKSNWNIFKSPYLDSKVSVFLEIRYVSIGSISTGFQ